MHSAIYRHFEANRVQASISTDNLLRVYECVELPSLINWQLPEEIDVLTLPSTSSPSSVSLAFATPTQTSATLEGASASLVAQALQQSQSQTGVQIRPGMGNREADGGWCLSWCKDQYWGEVIAVGCGIGGTIKVLFFPAFTPPGLFIKFRQIIQLSPSRRPTVLLVLDPSPTPYADEGTPPPPPAPSITIPATSTINDSDSTPAPYAITSVAWAPSCGRSYHLIATGSRDGHVRIWRVKPGDEGGEPEEGESEGKWTASVVADFDHHK